MTAFGHLAVWLCNKYIGIVQGDSKLHFDLATIKRTTTLGQEGKPSIKTKGADGMVIQDGPPVSAFTTSSGCNGSVAGPDRPFLVNPRKANPVVKESLRRDHPS